MSQVLRLTHPLGIYESTEEYQVGNILVYLPRVETALKPHILTYTNRILPTLLEEQEQVILLAAAVLQTNFPELNLPFKKELLVYSILFQPSVEAADFEVNFNSDSDYFDPYHSDCYAMTVRRNCEGTLSLLS